MSAGAAATVVWLTPKSDDDYVASAFTEVGQSESPNSDAGNVLAIRAEAWSDYNGNLNHAVIFVNGLRGNSTDIELSAPGARELAAELLRHADAAETRAALLAVGS